MQDFERLGSFYLGRDVDASSLAIADGLCLADAKDFTTHAIIIGMTGSGKTGLGVGLIEEAAIDKIPVIAVDPKGDLGNLLLTFPSLAPADFRPWVDAHAAQEQGLDPDAFAARQSETWQKGLADSGQDGARVQRLKDAAEYAIYTPGSSAGIPISVLRSFTAPPKALAEDADAWRERVQATATGVLTLVGVDGDPLQSREHMLLAAILEHAWKDGKDLDLAGLVAGIQQPPMTQVGVMDVDSFFPPKERFALAMKLNGLLASSAFQAWTQGVPLDAGALFYTPAGKPRVSVVSIAHLGDAERMFFLSMLLAEIIGWMRTQPGTGTLRALLYIDELFGFMPPTAAPPTKALLLTLLKQARAFGLGVVLATQNPVDLDYKGLSNAGTWFIGRLQTERDKKRLMDGLEGAQSGGSFDRAAMEQTIASLPKRTFILHSVKESTPRLFSTRWTLSYLAGPMTREQIKQVMEGRRPAVAVPAPGEAAAAAGGAEGASKVAAGASAAGARPVLAPAVPQLFLPVAKRAAPGATLVYLPFAAGAADIALTSAKYAINETRHLVRLSPIADGVVPVDWTEGQDMELDASALETTPADGATFGAVSRAAGDAKSYDKWTKSFTTWLKGSQSMTLWSCKAPKAVSHAGESEGEFRARLQTLAREARDGGVQKLRDKYASKVTTLEERLRKARAAVQREQTDASAVKVQAAVSMGAVILGALMGRRAVSAANMGRVGTAARTASRVAKESGDVGRATDTVAALEQQLADLQGDIEAKAQELGVDFDASTVELTEIPVKPKGTDITVHTVSLAWAPHWRGEGGDTAAWPSS